MQFPDGTDSVSRSSDFLINSLSSLTAVSENNAVSPVQVDRNECQIVRDGIDESLSDPSCGAAFAQDGDELAFAMRYKPYRDGLTTFLFNWQRLTAGDPELAGESYENFLAVEVFGDPPPIITSVEPKREFYRAGGEEITVMFDNVDDTTKRVLRVGDLEFPEVPGSFRKLPNGLYQAKYITQPGRGTSLDWTVEVAKQSGDVVSSELIDDAEDEKLSFIAVPLSIDSIEPPFAAGGEIVTLTGYFDQFDITRPEHEIFIGNKPLSELGVIPNITETSISFFIPVRDDVGDAYEFSISLVMNDEETTGSNDFAYIPEEEIALSIEVYGASYSNETNEYSLGQCDVVDYEANIPSGLSDPDEFEWKMYQIGDSTLFDLLTMFPDIIATKRQLRLPPKVFGGSTGSFEVFVGCTVQNVTLNSTVTVLKTEAPIIGVSLSRPPKRTLSNPSSPVRVDALIFPPDPECFSFVEGQRIILEWSYLGQSYIYPRPSGAAISARDSPWSARLGREFIIPQQSLQFGNLSLSLFTYVQDARSVQGTSSVSFEVVPSEMVPIIGFGAARVVHTAARPLLMTGERSFNPDDSVRDGIGVEAYQWGCRVSTKMEALQSGDACSSGFLPNPTDRSFEVSRETIRRLRNELLLLFVDNSEGDGTFHLEYSLSVGSIFGMSDPTFQVVTFLPTDKDVASLMGVTIYDNRGKELEWTRIPVSEEVVIVPEGDGVTWTYEIDFPPSGIGVFNDSDNLLTLPEYFDPRAPFPSKAALGFRPGTLQAAQVYEISILVYGIDDSFLPGKVSLRIRTLDLPKLILPELPLSKGDLKTTFSATARVNLDNTYSFLYSFHLVSAEGEEYCLDGCSGRSTVQFRVVETGTYNIVVRLRGVGGAALLAEKSYAETLIVTASTERPSLELSSLEALLTEAYRSGDHGTLEMLTAYLPVVSNSRGANSFSISEMETIRRLIAIMHTMVQNSAPTTITSKSYTKTIGLLASVLSDSFSSEEIVYTLFSMVHITILQVPQGESLDLEDELRAFYNFSARHVFRAFAGSSSRSLRQLTSLPEFELGARSLLVDLFLLQQEHLTIAISRDAYCGAVRNVNTIVLGGVPAREIRELVANSKRARARRKRQEVYEFVESYEQPTIPSFSSFTVGVLCTPRQAMGIRGESSNFTWCEDASEAGFVARDGIYILDPGQKKLFTLAETMDFVALSGLAEDDIQTDTSFLVTTNLTEVGSNGLRAFSFPEIDGCMAVNTSMIRLGVTGSRGCLSADAFAINTFGIPFTSRNAIQHIKRNFSSVSSIISRDRSSTILISASKTGAFGAIGKDCPINARKPIITPPEQDVEFAYLVFGGAVVAVVGVTVTWVATSTSYVGSIGSAAAAA